MNKLLLFFIFIFFFTNANAAVNWSHQHRYTLKKDEIANIKISTSVSKGEDKRYLTFSWTLQVADRITVLVHHLGYPHQYVLYKRRGLNSVRFVLLPNGSNQIEDNSFLLLTLSDINQGKAEVDFDIFIQDEKNRILVEF